MIKNIIRKLADSLGYQINKIKKHQFSDPESLMKPSAYIERYREVVSDPLNMLINRVASAGYADKDHCVILHNGNRVPVAGMYAYYEDFSDLLVINRGVHEPLEEYCFQQMLEKLKSRKPTMLELGAYWAHYSMWLKKRHPQSKYIMVEPDQNCLNCGKHNFALNRYEGEFINQKVSSNDFQLDGFIKQRGLTRIDILHADIQGFEMEMLDDAKMFLTKKMTDYIFVSTHSEKLHSTVLKRLKEYSYRIEVSSSFDTHTTSGDGFILATSPEINPLFENFHPLGRLDISKSRPGQLIQSITEIR